jgi:hypothetical protein
LPLKPTPSRHRFEKPIHNVKKLQGPWARILLKDQQISVLHHSDIWLARRRPTGFSACAAKRQRLVEPIGIEPMT